MAPKLSIQIVGWNSAKVLPAALAALDKIPEGEAVIHYIDNGSADASVPLVQQLLPHAQITRLSRNEGFAWAHNQGIAVCQTPFILLHDPDVQINWQGIVSLLKYFDNPRLGAIQGKLFRAEHRGVWRVIDSAGIRLSLALNGIERGSNQVAANQYNEEENIIAVTGACGLYRTAALQSIAYSPQEYFDNAFFSYKEDVDLGWRLSNARWQVRYVPIFMGTHYRTLGRRGVLNWGLNPVAIYRRLRSPRTRYSIRNWVWMIAKNASPLQLLVSGIPVLLRLGTFVFLSIVYPPLFTVWFEVLTGLPTCFLRRFYKSRPPVAT